jgi:hypothetical protein
LLLPLSRLFSLGLLPALLLAVLWGLMLSFFLLFHSLACLVFLSLQLSVSAVAVLVRSRQFRLLQLQGRVVPLSTGGQVVVSVFRFVFVLPSVRLLSFVSLRVVIPLWFVSFPHLVLVVRCLPVALQRVLVFLCSFSVSGFLPLVCRVLVVVLGHSSRLRVFQLVSGHPTH